MGDFRQKIEGAGSILMVNPRGLGDVVHSLPALAMVKASCPQAQIDILTSEHAQALFQVVPSVRQALSVPHYPRPRNRWERYGRRLRAALQIRRNHYDAIVNLQAIDSTSSSIALSGAPHRLAVRSMAMPVGMRWLYSDVAERPWRNQAAYRFMLDAMAEAGFPARDWHLGPGLLDLSAQRLPEGVREPFFHFSPFTSKTSRQLPPEQSRRLIRGLLQRYPGHQLLVSCADVPRETEALAQMLPEHEEPRIRAYRGSLNLAQLAYLLSRCEAHLGADTGSLHLAWLAGARTVSWFLNHESVLAWVPYGPQHRILLSLREQVRLGNHERDEAQAIPMQGIRAGQVLDTLDELLQARLPPRETWPSSERLEFRCVY